MPSVFPPELMKNELFFDLYAIERMTEFRLKNLLQKFQTPEAIFGAEQDDLLAVPGVDEELAKAILSYQRSKQTAERIKRAENLGVQVIGYLEENFPKNLRGVAHMPPVLFIRGEIREEDEQAVAVVGTRRPSHYGAQVAENLGKELAGAGITVISGLARGIDTYAHKGALNAGGRTIAVLGCGIDVYYPPENRQLCEAIVKQGAVISEYPLGMEPLAMNFPKRNRIISALAKAVVAVEAGEKSGVLNTCAWAKEQGREVFAVPGRIGDERSLGTNRLIRDGARILTEPGDILSWLGIKAKALPLKEVALAEEEKPVLEVIKGEPVHIDEICEALGMPMQQLLNLLFQLEVKGVIKQLPGKFFVRAG
ncbi:MAG: DNA-processing protein DprA [candidate division WOR-3 bacterium]